MVPDNEVLLPDIEETTYPDLTYKINIDKNRISEYVDELDAVIQAIYLILNTERYEYIIYSWDYGIELLDLYGMPMPYVISEIKRRVEDALTQDDRIDSVSDFTFEKTGTKLHVTFTVNSTFGDVETDMEVDV